MLGVCGSSLEARTMTSEELGSINLKELSKRAFSYFGGLSKNEVKSLVNYAMIIESANGNLKGALTTMSTKLKEALDEIEKQKESIWELEQNVSDLESESNELNMEKQNLEKHISELNARLEEKQAKIDQKEKALEAHKTALQFANKSLLGKQDLEEKIREIYKLLPEEPEL